MITIEVKSITPLPDGGNLKGYATVKVGPVTIHGCRIIQQPDQRAYVTGPQRQTQGGWRPVVTIEAQLRPQVEDAVLSRYGKDAQA